MLDTAVRLVNTLTDGEAAQAAQLARQFSSTACQNRAEAAAFRARRT